MIASFFLLASSINGLDPLSVEEHLAYYKLHPTTKEGKGALEHAWNLLGEGAGIHIKGSSTLPAFDLETIISLITKGSQESAPLLSPSALTELQEITKHLPTHALRGSSIWTKEEIISLPDKEVNLARALLIHQFEGDPLFKEKIIQYESALDIMALEIRARLPSWASDIDKIDMINRFIFEEKRYRFPPHSLYAKEIDLYTFLPAVLDSREGVCLGVSILYLCLSQRLGLPLEIITPPGHIYLRYVDAEQGEVINIETTARGIHMPSEIYLGINTRSLQTRTLKEVIGLSFINQASVSWSQGRYDKTIELYETARLYLKEDPLLSMLLGMNYLFVGNTKKGKELLTPLKSLLFDYAVSPETIPCDFLEGKADPESLKSIFTHVDETRESILEKISLLEKVVIKHPQFRAALMQLAVSHLQLGHVAEAVKLLEKYHTIDQGDATVEYYLAELYLERLDIQKAWHHFALAKKLITNRAHNPRALKNLKAHLLRYSPEM